MVRLDVFYTTALTYFKAGMVIHIYGRLDFNMPH